MCAEADVIFCLALHMDVTRLCDNRLCTEVCCTVTIRVDCRVSWSFNIVNRPVSVAKWSRCPPRARKAVVPVTAINTSEVKTGILPATLQDASRDGVSAGAGWSLSVYLGWCEITH